MSTKNSLINLPSEIKFTILSYFPICFILEILEISKNNKLNNNKQNNSLHCLLLKNKNYLYLQIHLMIYNLKTFLINDILILIENKYEKLILNKYLKYQQVDNYFELKVLSRIVMKLNYLLFLFKSDNDQCNNFNNLQNLLKKIENNFIEICWIFNKNEMFTKNNNTLQNALQNTEQNTLQNSDNNIYNRVKELIAKNDLILKNTNSIFRVHGLLYLNKNNEISFDILNIINLQQQNNLKKVINYDQMYFIINNNIQEIIFQNIIKGNLNTYLQFKCYNNLKNENLLRSFYGNIGIYFYSWFKKVNLKFYPLNKDEFIIKIYPSLFRLIGGIINVETILFFVIEFFILNSGYLFTFKLTRNFIKETEFTLFKIIYFMLDYLFSILFLYRLYNFDISFNFITNNALILKFLISYYLFGYKIAFGFPILELANNSVFCFVLKYYFKSLFSFNKSAFLLNWKERNFHLLFKRKLEVQKGNEFYKIKRKNKKWRWLGKLVVVAGGLIGYYFCKNNL
ncbi:hypothetical protein ABK040_001204 [Willaertia magna]